MNENEIRRTLHSAYLDALNRGHRVGSRFTPNPGQMVDALITAIAKLKTDGKL